jgi:hypothetical protein
MITVGDKTIKLQIWDTVHLNLDRPDRSPSSLLLVATTDQQQEPSSFTTSRTASPSTTCPGGWRRPRSTETARWCSSSWATNATWNQSTHRLRQPKGHLRRGSEVRQRQQPYLPGSIRQNRLPSRGVLQKECGTTT